MSVKKKKGQKSKQFLEIDQIIYRPKGWDSETLDYFIDSMVELVESLDGQMGGGFCLMDEAMLEEKWEMEDRKK